jgi:hypothetical protein
MKCNSSCKTCGCSASPSFCENCGHGAFADFRQTVAEALNIDTNTDAWMDGDVEREISMILSRINAPLEFSQK